MKIVRIFILSILICIGVSSCSTSTYVQPYVDDVAIPTEITYTTVVTYGIPYYFNGIISYYVYNGIYYYPYIWHNHWYVHPYTHVQPHGFIHRPHNGFAPDNRWRRPRHFNPNIHRRPSRVNHRPTDPQNRHNVIPPKTETTRPNINNRTDKRNPQYRPSSTRVTERQHPQYRPSSTRTTERQHSQYRPSSPRATERQQMHNRPMSQQREQYRRPSNVRQSHGGRH